MRSKDGPQRQCIGCRGVFPQHDLLRLVLGDKGSVCVDRTYRLGGRGVYLCPQRACIKKASKSRPLRRPLQSSEERNAFVARIVDDLRGDVCQRLQRFERQGRLKMAADIEADDILLVADELASHRRRYLETTTKGARVFLLPSSYADISSQCIVAKDAPGMNAFVRNLRFIERLAGKGLDV